MTIDQLQSIHAFAYLAAETSEQFERMRQYLKDCLTHIDRLHSAIRAHRDATGHDLCWYQPELWSLLPEGFPTDEAGFVDIPPVEEFLANCRAYRASLPPSKIPVDSEKATE